MECRNKLWIKFFLLAVFSTMYVRDHMRPAFHKALGINIDDYDMRVFRLTSEISRQVLPPGLDLDNPALHEGFRRMERINQKAQAASARGGLSGRIAKAWWGAAASGQFRPHVCHSGEKQRHPGDIPPATGLVIHDPHPPGQRHLIAILVWWLSTGIVLAVVHRSETARRGLPG